MNIHEWIRPSKRKWRRIREARDYEYVRKGYNELKMECHAEDTPFYRGIAKELWDLGLGPEARVIEAGCGAGPLCRQLRGVGFKDITAFDIADVNIEATRPFADRVFRGSCEDIPEGDSTYDIAAAINVIEHVIDVPKTLAELHRVVKPGGRLYLTTDNSWWMTVQALRRFITPPSMWYRGCVQPIDGDFTTSEMTGLLEDAGFKTVRLVGIGGIPIGNRLVEGFLGSPTIQHPVLKHYTTRMAILARKDSANRLSGD